MTENKHKNIFVIIGSASTNSANEKLVDYFVRLSEGFFNCTVFTGLKSLPHFDPEHSSNNPPEEVIAFRDAVRAADGVVICTPEYVFSIPSGLKNAIEWCVATTVFSDKPVGLITASANGQKGHEELQLIMRTIMAKFDSESTLLIQGVKGKVNDRGEITDVKTREAMERFINGFKVLFGDQGKDR